MTTELLIIFIMVKMTILRVRDNYSDRNVTLTRCTRLSLFFLTFESQPSVPPVEAFGQRYFFQIPLAAIQKHLSQRTKKI